MIKVKYKDLEEISFNSPKEAIEYIKAFAEQNDLENFGDEKENPTECMCRKCGVGLQCEHAIEESHIQSLCGNCS